jgi:diphosphomevalonate decarboxylase
MTLDACTTVTTAETSDIFSEDSVEIRFQDGTSRKIQKTDGDKNSLVFEQIERIRKSGNISGHVKVVSQNNFPISVGLASSASGFAALTLAVLGAVNSEQIIENKKELSRLILEGGSASAMRSVFGGFVESHIGNTLEECFSERIAPENYWNLLDIIAVVDNGGKNISSLDGHDRASSSPYFQGRILKIHQRLQKCKKAIIEKNFSLLGQCIESDTVSMHKVAMTSIPPANYFTSGTRRVLSQIPRWRVEGLRSYFSIDAGANVHVICQEKDAEELRKKLTEIPEVRYLIVNRPGRGAELISEHLF